MACFIHDGQLAHYQLQLQNRSSCCAQSTAALWKQDIYHYW